MLIWTRCAGSPRHTGTFLPLSPLRVGVPVSRGAVEPFSPTKIVSVKKKSPTGNGSTTSPTWDQASTTKTMRICEMSPAAGRFECYWQTRKESNSAWPEKEADCRKACEMSEAEVKWLEDELAEASKMPVRARNGTKGGQQATPEANPALAEAKRQRISEDCIAWRIGEQIRLRRIWMETAEDWALETIKNRRIRMEVKGFSMADFLLPVSRGDDASLNHAKRWLPVYYEYARQSSLWLQWARMRHTRGRDPMRGSQCNKFAELHLQRTLGRGWIDALSSLAAFLGEDLVFTEIPMDQRIEAAQLASFSCGHNIAVDPESWGLIDGGRPTCPPEAKWAGRRPLDVANRAQATKGRTVNSFDSRTRKLEAYEVRNVLNATVEESFLKFTHPNEPCGKEEIEWRNRDDLSQRNIDDAGAEIIVLRVDWKHACNKEIGEAMRSLCEAIRPKQWPEPRKAAGDKDQSAEKALRILLYWRIKTAAGKDSTVESLEEARLKKGLGKQLKALGVIRNPPMAAKWFKDITGDAAPPWWSKSVTN